MNDPLPIDAVLPEIRRAVASGHVVVHAETGAGKTTRVPPALLDAIDGTILVLEPRRVAARAAARRIASERGERVGDVVGVQVRHERRVSQRTRLLVATEGVALRKLAADPLLEGVGAVVIDEIHERSLDTDLALAMLRHLHRELRPDLRLIAMSATADTKRLSEALDAPVVHCPGRTFPVDIDYLPRPDDRRTHEVVRDAVLDLLPRTEGDLLVFLPGSGEIRRAAGALAPHVHDVDVLPLHGRLSPAEQDRALSSGPRRRIVLSTNVAETSVTIPGVRVVIDTGTARRPHHDTARGLDRLRLEPISQASADQRAGRAGRTAPGRCLRLWTERSHDTRAAHDSPAILREDLSGALLLLHAWGEPDPSALSWLQPPPERALDAAETLLHALDAIDEAGHLTPVGQAMAAIPASPRIARALVAAHELGVLDEVAVAAALLSDRLPFRRTGPPPPTSSSDVDDLLAAVEQRGSRGWTPVSSGALKRTQETADQLARAARRAAGPAGRATPDGLVRALVAGWPDRVARRRSDGRLLLANGRGAVLDEASAVRDAPWLLALDVHDDAGAEARVRLAVPVDPAMLDRPDQHEVVYDAERDRVVGVRRARWGALVLREQHGQRVDPAQAAATLAEAARAAPERAVPLDDPALANLLGRLRLLRQTRPALEVSDLDVGALVEIAMQRRPDLRRLADLRGLTWQVVVTEHLPWPVRQALDAVVPERLGVPSGSSIRLDYTGSGAPVLAVSMQELFGLDRTPQVAGRPVLLHLLAPNRRVQQVTDDLAGFWARSWPEIRKELRGRYPKHDWPEDPVAASPRRRPGRR